MNCEALRTWLPRIIQLIGSSQSSTVLILTGDLPVCQSVYYIVLARHIGMYDLPGVDAALSCADVNRARFSKTKARQRNLQNM